MWMGLGLEVPSLLWVVNMAEPKVAAKLSISGPHLQHGLSDLKDEENYGSK